MVNGDVPCRPGGGPPPADLLLSSTGSLLAPLSPPTELHHQPHVLTPSLLSKQTYCPGGGSSQMNLRSSELPPNGLSFILSYNIAAPRLSQYSTIACLLHISIASDNMKAEEVGGTTYAGSLHGRRLLISPKASHILASSSILCGRLYRKMIRMEPCTVRMWPRSRIGCASYLVLGPITTLGQFLLFWKTEMDIDLIISTRIISYLPTPRGCNSQILARQ